MDTSTESAPRSVSSTQNDGSTAFAASGYWRVRSSAFCLTAILAAYEEAETPIGRPASYDIHEEARKERTARQNIFLSCVYRSTARYMQETSAVRAMRCRRKRSKTSVRKEWTVGPTNKVSLRENSVEEGSDMSNTARTLICTAGLFMHNMHRKIDSFTDWLLQVRGMN